MEPDAEVMYGRRCTDLGRSLMRSMVRLVMMGFFFGCGLVASMYSVSFLAELIGRFVS